MKNEISKMSVAQNSANQTHHYERENNNGETMGLVGIYVRSSVDRENASIEQQKELGIKFCNSHNFQYKIYEDVGKSGFKLYGEEDIIKNRCGLTKLIEDVETKVIDKIWFIECGRLSRDAFTLFTLFRIFEKSQKKYGN